MIPAYQAGAVLAATVRRIPERFFESEALVVIVNDASPDDTGEVADRLAAENPCIQALHHPANRGYGGAQKSGLLHGLEQKAAAFAVVHADGQYAPERVLDLLAPILRGEADLVQGSRLAGGGALAGGMPLTRYLANRVLTTVENIAFGTAMAEFHSGYMLYSRSLLERLPFTRLRDDFNFDAEIILLAHLAGIPCKEIPIPTHYGDESSSLDPIPYGLNVLRMIARHLGGHYRRLLREPATTSSPAITHL